MDQNINVVYKGGDLICMQILGTWIPLKRMEFSRGRVGGSSHKSRVDKNCIAWWILHDVARSMCISQIARLNAFIKRIIADYIHSGIVHFPVYNVHILR